MLRLVSSFVAAILLTSPALAAGYTLADVVAASRQGLPESVVLGMVETPAQPWAIDGETTLQLLRAGVSPSVIHALSSGAHPTPIEVETAKLPGPVWGEAPPEASALTGTSPPDDAASEYQRLIAAERRPPGRRADVTNLHGERYTAATNAMFAGGAETALGLVTLAALSGERGEATNGLHLAGTGLCFLGTGSVVVGSLVAADALHDDGYRVSPVTGWIGLGVWGTGVLLYGGNTLVQGEPTPFAPGAVFLAGGTVLGAVQGMVNAADRRREIRMTGATELRVTPVAQADGAGVVVSGVW